MIVSLGYYTARQALYPYTILLACITIVSRKLLLGKVLASSRAEAEDIRSQVVGTETRIAEAIKEVEATRDEMSKQREDWRKTEEDQKERLRQLEDVSACLLFCFPFCFGPHNYQAVDLVVKPGVCVCGMFPIMLWQFLYVLMPDEFTWCVFMVSR